MCECECVRSCASLISPPSARELHFDWKSLGKRNALCHINAATVPAFTPGSCPVKPLSSFTGAAGFEPFGEHSVNSSWVAVQELGRYGLGEAVDLHVCEVPVEYQAVQSLITSLWKEHQPQLVVHVGVSGLATTVTLEQCAHNKGYKRLDNCSFCPASQCCMENGPDSIRSLLDMSNVCKRVNNSGLGVTLSVSKDAGRYLCDYTYYTSLYLGQGRSAFIHVPPLGKPYSSLELSRALHAAIQEMLKLLELNHN